jgi:hypothetical protein
MSELRAEMNDAVNDEAERARERIAAALRADAVARFDAHGGHDPRGAALWDVHVAIREKGYGR